MQWNFLFIMPEDIENRNQVLQENGYHIPEDLLLNRQRQLSEEQKRMLLRSKAFWFVVLAVDIVAVLFLFIQLFLVKNPVFVFVIWIIFLVGGIRLTLNHLRPIYMDVQNGEVKTSTGKINKMFVSSGDRYRRGRFCLVQVNDQVFTVNPWLYDILEDHEGYRFFFVPHTKSIVNIEAY